MPNSKSELSRYMVGAEVGSCINAIRSNFDGQYLRPKKLFNERYQIEMSQRRNTGTDELDAWSLARLILANGEAILKTQRYTIDSPVRLHVPPNEGGEKRFSFLSIGSIQNEEQVKFILEMAANLQPTNSIQFQLNPDHSLDLANYSTPFPETGPAATYGTSVPRGMEPEINSAKLQKKKPKFFRPFDVDDEEPTEMIAKVHNYIPMDGNCNHNDSTNPGGEQTNSNVHVQSSEMIIDLTDSEGNSLMILQQRKRKNVAKMSGNSNKKRKLTTESTEAKPFKCEFCSYSSAYKSNLTDHTRIHTGEKPFKCEVCTSAFKQRSTLRSHMRTHADQFPFQCSICRQGFLVEQEWESHEQSCNIVRYDCHLCEFTSLRKYHFVRHMLVHTGVKPFQCSKCPGRFTRKDYLNRHMKGIHFKSR